jgi:hypothetical protein
LDELKRNNIKSIGQFSKNEDYNIIKAEVEHKELLDKMISDGIFIGYKRVRIEKYVQPVNIIQCFKCQKFGHVASNCKATESTCVKCSGHHKIKDCKETVLKCANCGKEHASSYGGCPFKQAQIKDKTEKINNKTTSILRSYSSVLNLSLNQNKVNTFEEVLKNIEEKIEKISTNINERLDNIEKNFNQLIK